MGIFWCGAKPLNVATCSRTALSRRAPAFSRNVRNELKKNRKIYFYDNGIRNAIINIFKPIHLRTDAGALRENFLVAERTKWPANRKYFTNRYCWRTTKQQEINYPEEKDGDLYAWKFKWRPAGRTSFPRTFLNAYAVPQTEVVTPENYLGFVMPG